MDNPETSETLGTQVGVIKNGQSRDIGNIGHTSRGNQEWIMQRHRKHWAHNIQDENKLNKEHNTEN